MMFNKKIKYFFIVCSMTAILFPLINIYYVFPLFTGLVVKNTEDEAQRVAKNLAAIVISRDADLKDPSHFSEKVDKIREAFNLEKIKVFSQSGEIIYSTDAADIGTMNDNSYFHEIVASGSTYTKTVKKDSQTLEGRTMQADVVETYVPIMENGSFVGAFEIYYNITERSREINRMVLRSSLITLALTFSFFMLIILIIYKTENKSGRLTASVQKASYQSPFYLLLVMMVSLFISEIFVMFFMSVIPRMSKISEAVLDSTLLVMIVSPILYFFLFHPLLLHISRRKRAEERLKEAHLKLKESHAQLQLEIMERERAQKQTLEIKQDWEDTFNSITDMITIHDSDFNIIRSNRAAQEGLGLPAAGGKMKCFKYYHGTKMPPEGCPSCKCLETGQQAVFETFEPHLKKDIEIRTIPRFDDDGNVKGLIHVVRDISRRKQMEEKLKEMSLRDDLTGLYNRRGFFMLLHQQVKIVKRQNSRSFLLYADVDSFKEINDTLGHQVGDVVLTDTADIFRATFRETDIIGRIGGDEFVVFLEGINEENVNVKIAGLQKNIADYNARIKRAYSLSVSIGVAAYDPESLSSIDELIAAADKRMYEQKRDK